MLFMTFDKFLLNHLKEIGMKEEYYVLDFGCGEGNYSIPTARVVGINGRVFAVDEDDTKLKQLKVNAEKYGIKDRFQIIKNDGNLNLSLENESIDLTLLYNVTCCILGKDDFPKFQSFIEEIHRITKRYGKIVIGIKEGKTMKNRIETAIPLIQENFTLVKHKRGKYFDGEKLRNGLFYFLTKNEI